MVIYLIIFYFLVAKLKAGDKLIRVRTLSEVPLGLLLKAGKALSESSDKIMSSVFRRIIVIAVYGGIAIDFLKSANVSYYRNQFKSAGVPMNLAKGLEIKLIEHVYQHLSDFFLLLDDMEPQFYLESFLRAYLWDFTLKTFLMEVDEPMIPVPEFHIDVLIDMDSPRKVDLAVLDVRFRLPILMVEIGKEPI